MYTRIVPWFGGALVVGLSLACGGTTGSVVVAEPAASGNEEGTEAPEPGITVVLNGESTWVSERVQQADASDWTLMETLTAFPGEPTHYRVDEGGGEGDCATDVFQWQVDGEVHTRLFFMASCYGDTSEETVRGVPLPDGRFALHSEKSFLADAEMNDDGTWSGTAARHVVDRVYRWRAGEGLAFIEEVVVESSP